MLGIWAVPRSGAHKEVPPHHPKSSAGPSAGSQPTWAMSNPSEDLQKSVPVSGLLRPGAEPWESQVEGSLSKRGRNVGPQGTTGEDSIGEGDAQRSNVQKGKRHEHRDKERLQIGQKALQISTNCCPAGRNRVLGRHQLIFPSFVLQSLEVSCSFPTCPKRQTTKAKQQLGGNFSAQWSVSLSL